ncbi:uncharacterized protein LOC116349991 [Contarinia nasturtii]|uniref:uncharacterized protein LOC116341823 n=1 Tax=Contarinia nasturtii TaxID=265458 RepID=UPI0012D4A4E5|nr:uncharacterized protein LOC116341823 [Contarinia nasturtii]XP_031637560.1 uncharacterized protein LOC116349991 [Contarinia nasturtii]
MKPLEVDSTNESHLRNTVYNYKRLEPSDKAAEQMYLHGKKRPLHRRRAKFHVGDHVRLSKYRSVFDKSYTINFTPEIFTIRCVRYSTDPITYLLSDYQNQEIKGSVYEHELQAVKHPNVYLVEKILRKRNGRSYVKWLGFGSEHNSWIDDKDII